MVTAYIGIGSNLGDRQKYIGDAIEYLKRTQEIKVIKASSLYETEPEDVLTQGKFLNGAVKIETSLSARELLGALQSIENMLGRVRQIPNGPRTIDLDILTYADMTIDEDDLKIPHPRMRIRQFVMRPLTEIMDSGCEIIEE